ncbi:MAG: transposase family protein [Prevotella bivia]|nr:transposase family protein [Prevotella bivia]
MNSSFLYHAWGLYSLECTREEYKGNKIILHVQNKKRLSVCPKCGKLHLVKNGYRIRDFLGLPIGGKKIVIRMKVQRYKCNDCWKSHTNLTHAGKYFRPSKVKITSPTLPK